MKPDRGLIINQAADALVDYLPLPGPLERTTPRDTVVEGFHQIVDQYAGTQVSHIFFNASYQRTAYPSRVWQSFWDVPDPETDISGWHRLTWLVHETGVDLYAVCIERCRRHGISPWLSVRMNDTHYGDDPHAISSLWWDHPEWHLEADPHNGFDWHVPEVHAHYLALIAELLDRYDADGLELDWLRFPWYFKHGEESAGRAKLTAFMRDARRLADESAARRGHPIGIAARVPAVPDFALGLGIDAVTWAHEGLADMLILGGVWRPSDTDPPIEQWRQQIGTTPPGFVLAAGTDLWLVGSAGGPTMMSDAESMRGFTASTLDRGADQIYLFNHFARPNFDRPVPTPDGGQTVGNDYDAIINEGACLDTVLGKPRRHVLTWHDPVPYSVDYHAPLPAEVGPGTCAAFRVHTGPRPTRGRVVVRVGLDDQPGLDTAQLSVRLNGAACRAMADLPRVGPYRPGGRQGNGVVDFPAEVAPRVLQFDVPLDAVQRGYNVVEVAMAQGPEQRLTWLEVYVVPSS